jgi:hypothetical protein
MGDRVEEGNGGIAKNRNNGTMEWWKNGRTEKLRVKRQEPEFGFGVKSLFLTME